jgi:phage tail-like protein
MLTDSKVIAWLLDALQNRKVEPAQINVSLLNENHDPLKTWKVFRAWPRKWQVSDFNAQENAVVVETLELSYSHVTVE